MSSLDRSNIHTFIELTKAIAEKDMTFVMKEMMGVKKTTDKIQFFERRQFFIMKPYSERARMKS